MKTLLAICLTFIISYGASYYMHIPRWVSEDDKINIGRCHQDGNGHYFGDCTPSYVMR